mmetsp:Transcript_8174/g.16491  ORF Transcript_8174/g.16491 Transcript_8174/m.16491 type:complete len:88 (-) Transcript_8174:660-923(-)
MRRRRCVESSREDEARGMTGTHQIPSQFVVPSAQDWEDSGDIGATRPVHALENDPCHYYRILTLRPQGGMRIGRSRSDMRQELLVSV